MKKLLIVLAIFFSTLTVVYAAGSTTDAMLQYNQGIDFYKVGQYDKAITAFKKAIELNPNYIDAYYNLGSILEYLGQNEAALSTFKQIILRKPNDYESLYKAAYLSAKTGEINRAKDYLALIPPTSGMYNNAQELAYQLNVNLKDVQKAPAQPKVPQSNGMYENITGPTGLTTDKNGNLYVAGFSDNSILKITPDEKRIIFAKNPKLNGPIDIDVDAFGNVYVANYNNDNVLKISSDGVISVLIGNVKKPYGLHVDGNILFVSSQGSNSVLRYKLR